MMDAAVPRCDARQKGIKKSAKENMASGGKATAAAQKNNNGNNQ